MSGVHELGDRVALPGNRFDLLDGREPVEDPTVSVVIPYFDDQAGLDLLLAALAQQDHPATRLQVVVADDGSPTPPRVRPGVLVVRQEDLGFRAGTARNLGVRHSDGEVVCFLDGDTVPAPDYVRRAARLPGLTADALVVGRRRHADLTGLEPSQLSAFLADPGDRARPEPAWLADEYRRTGNLLHAGPSAYRFVISAVLTCTRELFEEIGGFDDGFDAYGGEDWELAYRALTAGAVIAHEPRAVGWHHGPDWAARGSEPDRRAQKNAETMRLAALIPDPALRGPGRWPPYCRVVVRAAGGDDDAWLLAARSVLTAFDDADLWVDQRIPALADDPRVHTGEVPEAVAARAAVHIQLLRPVVLDRELAGKLETRLHDPAVGQVSDASGSVVATSTRAQRRAARHGLPLRTLFEEVVLPASAGDAEAAQLWRDLPRLGQ